MEGYDSGVEIRGAVGCFSGAENRGSLALVLCVCSCAEEKLQQRVRRKNCSSRFLYSIKKKS